MPTTNAPRYVTSRREKFSASFSESALKKSRPRKLKATLTPVVPSVRATTPASWIFADLASSDVVQYGAATLRNRSYTSPQSVFSRLTLVASFASRSSAMLPEPERTATRRGDCRVNNPLFFLAEGHSALPAGDRPAISHLPISYVMALGGGARAALLGPPARAGRKTAPRVDARDAMNFGQGGAIGVEVATEYVWSSEEECYS
mmetsp:Transcript_12131/g.38428  ORF Transcript_12131/g.38428 Transcript_12131/m.38428 type:complete len:204 (+) Transcript_12131:1189-1800(+)